MVVVLMMAPSYLGVGASGKPGAVHCSSAALSIDAELARLVADEAAPGASIDPIKFWSGFSDLLAEFAPRNAAVLAMRDDL
ncbi:malate synthase [Rhodoblastus sphagnicola]|nr:malate synthase [Rhodoblastus sphagnicola]